VLITLGVSSSISSYKAAEILRLFQKAGHTVRVAMTRNATRFIRPILFQSLSQHPVYLDEFKAKRGEVLHVELARETQLLVIAPATASIIGKFASGIADDFLSTLFLARRCPALIAPAMNVFMYRNPVVQQNIERLKSSGVVFVEPDEGYLACGDEGPGRLAPIEEIVARSLALLTTGNSLRDQHVVVTAGPTWEALDPVRIITNRSSGKMGYAIAEEAALRGAKVTLISGPTQILPPPSVTTIRVESASDMKRALMDVYDSADYVIKAAAVSDFKPEQKLSQKKKKTGKPEVVNLEPTDDILAELGRKKSHQILVGFCMETENLEANAKNKLQRKNLDFIVANEIRENQSPFQSEENEVLVLDRLGHRDLLSRQKKTLIAEKLWDLIVERSPEIRTQPVSR
jgi:phosphopantothenoylcysteine decarboxylase / phosphopantothenate---cysteine ligase